MAKKEVPPKVKNIRKLLRNGKIEEASLLMRKQKKLAANRPKLAQRILDAHVGQNDWVGAAKFIVAVGSVQPKLMTLDLALKFSEVGEDSAAEIICDMIASDMSKLKPADLTALSRLRMTLGQEEFGTETLRDAAKDGSGRPKAVLALAMHLRKLQEHEEAATLLKSLLERDLKKALADRVQVELLDTLCRSERYQEAQQMLSSLDAKSVEQLPPELTNVVNAGGAFGFPGKRIEISTDMTLYHMGGDKVLLFMGWIMDFRKGARIEQLGPLLERLGVSFMVVKDRRRSLSLSGIGEWHPSRADTVAAIRNMLHENGLKRLATFGGSGTGLPSLIYGAELGAEGSINFSGFTYLPDEEELSGTWALGLTRAILKRLPEDDYSARPSVESSPKMVVHQHYPELNDIDRRQAEAIGDLPNVSLFPRGISQHSTFSDLSEAGQLDEAFTHFFRTLGWVE